MIFGFKSFAGCICRFPPDVFDVYKMNYSEQKLPNIEILIYFFQTLLVMGVVGPKPPRQIVVAVVTSSRKHLHPVPANAVLDGMRHQELLQVVGL